MWTPPCLEDVKKDKKFDAVKMMREIRDKLSRLYKEDPETEERDLEFIRSKYKVKSKNVKVHSK
jgi:hypothetical protein